MACKYAMFHNPKSAPGGEKYMHPRAVDNGKTDLKGIIRKMSANSTLSQAQLQAVVQDLLDTVASELAEGKNVHINGLGEFKIALQCPPGIRDASEVRAERISVRGVSYKVDAGLKNALQSSTRFQRTTPVNLSQPLTTERALELARGFFADPANKMRGLTSRIFARLANVNQQRASDMLHMLEATKHLANPSYDVHHPVYMPGEKL